MEPRGRFSRAVAGRALVGLLGAALLLVLVPATSAHAAFPGQNGKIAFDRMAPTPANGEIYAVNPDGSGVTNLTNNASDDTHPAWSPDGRKIAFASSRLRATSGYDIFTMNADGSAVTRVTNQLGMFNLEPAWSPDGTRIAFVQRQSGIEVVNADGTDRKSLGGQSGEQHDPAWSPDGSKIAYWVQQCLDPDCNTEAADVWVMNADGTGKTHLASSAMNPNWSPDGQKLVFTCGSICTMNPDGTGQQSLPPAPTCCDYQPAWSPDGSKIVFFRNQGDGTYGVYTMNSDGSDPTQVTDCVTTYCFEVDWQPLPHQSSPAPTYDHSRLASPARVPLVPNFRQTISSSQCTSRGGLNSTHGPPLSLSSCNPPGFTPGTQAHMGPGSSSWSAYAVIYGDTNPGNGDQANMTLRASLNDIRTAGGADYNPNAAGPDLTLVTKLRFTDRFNGGSQTDPATVSDFDYQTPIDCTSTVGSEGATCSLDTSADAITPDTIRENKATVMQVFRYRVNDSGTNGTRGDTDDRTFAVQGIYIR
jgi:Tol biopolymer transport system component